MDGNEHLSKTFFSNVGNPDTLICGNCRECFLELGELLDHKRSYCKLRFTCKCQENFVNSSKFFYFYLNEIVNVSGVGIEFYSRDVKRRWFLTLKIENETCWDNKAHKPCHLSCRTCGENWEIF